jgi:hypothetical protein
LREKRVLLPLYAKNPDELRRVPTKFNNFRLKVKVTPLVAIGIL